MSRFIYVVNNSEKNVFFEKRSLYPSSGMVWLKMTIFSITQPFLDGSFSSSNLTEISMRLNCVENFITIWLSFRKLSCKRPAGHWPIIVVYSLFEYTENPVKFTNVSVNIYLKVLSIYFDLTGYFFYIVPFKFNQMIFCIHFNTNNKYEIFLIISVALQNKTKFSDAFCQNLIFNSLLFKWVLKTTCTSFSIICLLYLMRNYHD